jgi:hypothetical protein
VVRLAEYRMRRRNARRQPAAPAATPTPATGNATGPQYFCTRCDADEFRLFASGKAHCAHCGAMMRNLAIKGESA